MKKSNFLRTAIITLGTLFLSSSINAADFDATKYTFRGDKLGKRICKSVVKDDTTQLTKLLRREKLRVLSLKPVDHKYTCNKMNLYSFAVRVNADESQKYLISLDQNRGFYAPKARVYVEEVASK